MSVSDAETRPPYRAEYACAIWHPSGARLLAIKAALPELVSGESVYTSPGGVQVRDALGLEVRVLRRLGFERDLAQNRARMAFELEVVSGADSIQTDARWVDLAELSSLKLEVHRELAKTVLEEGACVPALRPARARRGWWTDALAWLDTRLESLGGIRTGLEQQKTWQISSLSRLETSLGRLYFKAVPPFLAREPP